MNSTLKPNYYFEDLRFMVFFPLVFLLLAMIFEYSGFDLWWVSHFFDYDKTAFLYKSHWLFKTGFHKGGQWFDKLIVLTWLISFVIVNVKENLRKYRKIMLYFLVAGTMGPVLVGIGKSTSHIQTPSHLSLFNGNYPYIRLFDHLPAGVPVGHAFPAGHASGGYGLLCLYFVLLHFRSEKRLYGLIPGILTGLVFGISQQIRGEHFPSHDLVTLVICWYSALLIYLLFYPREVKFLLKSKSPTIVKA